LNNLKFFYFVVFKKNNQNSVPQNFRCCQILNARRYKTKPFWFLVIEKGDSVQHDWSCDIPNHLRVSLIFSTSFSFILGQQTILTYFKKSKHKIKEIQLKIEYIFI